MAILLSTGWQIAYHNWCLYYYLKGITDSMNHVTSNLQHLVINNPHGHAYYKLHCIWACVINVWINTIGYWSCEDTDQHYGAVHLTVESECSVQNKNKMVGRQP